MRQIAIVLFGCAAAALAQNGRIAGTVTDDSGVPIDGAMVMAGLRSSPIPITPVAGKPPVFMPVMANAVSGSKGTFEIDGLLVGTYALCVEKPESAVLNPCLWTDQPVTVVMGPAATVSGVSVVALKGVIVTVRVQDPSGALAADPAGGAIRIGTYHGKSPFIPARISGRDANGRTMSLVVLPGQPANITVSSSSFALADGNGTALGTGETQIPIPSSALANAWSGQGVAPPPAITVQVTGASSK